MKFSIATVAMPNVPQVAAFAEVAEALLYGLRELGHESAITGGKLFERTNNILFGSQLMSPQVAIYPQTILINLEPLENNPYLPPQYFERLRSHTVWDYSAANVRLLREAGATRVFHLPMGYVPQLTRIRPQPRDVDVLF